MKENFNRSLQAILRHEGGFVDHPSDPGGATNKGVTLKTYRRYKPGATVADLKAISDDELGRIYRDGYWDRVRGDDLPAGLDLCLFDYGVNSGTGRPARAIQRLVSATVDGAIGPRTLAAIRGHTDIAALINGVCDERLAFMQRAKNRKTGELLWPVFGRGWQRRVDEVRADSLALAKVPANPR